MAYFGTGMASYERILQDSRVNDKPVGPQHHLHNAQRKEWEKKNPTKEKLNVEDAKAKVNKAADDVKNAVAQTRKVIASIKIKPIPTKESLKQKLKEENMKKLGDSLKVVDRCDHIKSSGNGL